MNKHIVFNYKGFKVIPVRAAHEMGTDGGWFDIISERHAPSAMASTQKGYNRIDARFNASGVIFLSRLAMQKYLTAWEKKPAKA